jgi:hypothetical protein
MRLSPGKELFGNRLRCRRTLPRYLRPASAFFMKDVINSTDALATFLRTLVTELYRRSINSERLAERSQHRDLDDEYHLQKGIAVTSEVVCPSEALVIGYAC